MTHRPELHVTPGTGVLRAPAAALFDGTIWHVFHQFQPRTTEGSRWAHQYSDGSPFSFEECDDVLAPEGMNLKSGPAQSPPPIMKSTCISPR